MSCMVVHILSCGVVLGDDVDVSVPVDGVPMRRERILEPGVDADLRLPLGRNGKRLTVERSDFYFSVCIKVCSCCPFLQKSGH